MRCTAPQLRDAFISICNRLITTNVQTEGGFDDRRVQVTRTYSGIAGTEEHFQGAVLAGLNPVTVQPGAVYFASHDVVTFLNAAWEKLHNSYMTQISQILLNKQVPPTAVEDLCYKHDQLYLTSGFIQEIESDGWGEKVDVTTTQSRIFPIPNEMMEYGPPTIVSCVIHDFKGEVTGSNYPQQSRVCRLIGVGEIGGLVNLAMNSRYTSGALFRHRKFSKSDKTMDVVEVYHNSQRTEGFWSWIGAGGTMVQLCYIKYPKPLTVEEIEYTPDEESEPEPRIIEVAYAMDIAMEAAKIAMLRTLSNGPNMGAGAEGGAG